MDELFGSRSGHEEFVQVMNPYDLTSKRFGPFLEVKFISEGLVQSLLMNRFFILENSIKKSSKKKELHRLVVEKALKDLRVEKVSIFQ